MAIFTKVEETTILGNTVNRLFTNVLSYDIGRDDCRVRYELLATGSGLLYSEDYEVPENVLANWGTDDKVILQSIATAKNLNITGYPTGSL